MAFPVPLQSKRDRFLQSAGLANQGFASLAQGLGSLGQGIGAFTENAEERYRREQMERQKAEYERRLAEEKRFLGLAEEAERLVPVPKPVEMPGIGPAPPIPGVSEAPPFMGPALATAGPFAPPPERLPSIPGIGPPMTTQGPFAPPKAELPPIPLPPPPQVPGTGPAMGQIGETPEPWQIRAQRASLLRDQAYAARGGDTAGIRQIGQEIRGLSGEDSPDSVRADMDLLAAMQGADSATLRSAFANAKSKAGRRSFIVEIGNALQRERADADKREGRSYSEKREETAHERRIREEAEERKRRNLELYGTEEPPAEGRIALEDRLIKGRAEAREATGGKPAQTFPSFYDDERSRLKQDYDLLARGVNDTVMQGGTDADIDAAKAKADAAYDAWKGYTREKAYAEWQKEFGAPAAPTPPSAPAAPPGPTGFTTKETPADIRSLSEAVLLARFKASTNPAEKAILKAERDRRKQAK